MIFVSILILIFLLMPVRASPPLTKGLWMTSSRWTFSGNTGKAGRNDCAAAGHYCPAAHPT